MSEALSLGDVNDCIVLQLISIWKKFKLPFSKCHYKRVAIGQGDVSLSIWALSAVIIFINFSAMSGYCLLSSSNCIKRMISLLMG